MEFFSPEFWSVIFSIVIIDLVLAGDNAIVIGLAARHIPKEYQKRVILGGTLGAIIVRSILTMVVVWLLRIPGLLLLGGLLLIWIAYKLLVEEKKHGEMKLGNSIWSAIKTIVVADSVMGLDNVLAVAGAAHGNFGLVIMGLLISVPIVVWGSTIILVWVERYPAIIYLGAGVLAWTAAKMIADERLLTQIFTGNSMLEWGLSLIIISGVLILGKIKNSKTGLANEDLG
ncbi:MAG: TerC family protein [Syntrophomonadaceae bacterium]|nr:TerC family protein [Syntrophomonadaceae bacterium]